MNEDEIGVIEFGPSPVEQVAVLIAQLEAIQCAIAAAYGIPVAKITTEKWSVK